MKKYFGFLVVAFLLTSTIGSAQVLKTLPNWRPNDQRGLNVFEAPKLDTVEFDGVRVRVGGDFAMQFQGLSQSNTNDTINLVDLATNFNLPTANLNLDVQLSEGLQMHLRMYLSSRHHVEAWIKGGHLKIDKLDFIKEGFAEGLMEHVRIKIGLDEINYGDAHFRRSDNARAIYNPFVGNYIMDAFSTEAFGEVYVFSGPWLGMLAISNGKLNQSVTKSPSTDNKTSFYGKVGYDNLFDNDLRFRLTGSWYINNGTSTGFYLYGGDRAGGRYYGVPQTADEGSDFDPRFNPRFREMTSFVITPFISYRGLELFGFYEVIGSNADEGGQADGQYNQYAAELIYRFGSRDQIYLGARYNAVDGEINSNAANQKINRFNIGAGWFLTKNIVTKLEYVNQQYDGDGWNGTRFQGAEFNGVVVEAAISF